MDYETVKKSYIARNKCETLTEYDNRLIQAIFNLRKNYAQEIEKRRASILIDHAEVFVAPVIKSKETKKDSKKDSKKESKKETKKEPKEETCVKICQATKMDGNQCTAKAKQGCVFCGRHLPKQN